jgi:DNA-binding response OmpR family regulator
MGLRNQGIIKVLFINNDYEPAMTLKKGLEEYGYKVYYFTNVFAALQDVEKTKMIDYWMVLYDMNVSDNECLLFAKQIRELSPIVKIFLMSS